MIKPLPQTTKGLKEVIQAVGCFFRSSQAIAEIEANKNLTIDQINDMWEWAKSKGYIDNSNKMKMSATIANRTLEVLGIKNKKIYEIATATKGIPKYYASIPLVMRKPQYFIRKIRNQFGGTHFLVTSRLGDTIFDPDNSAIEKAEIYTICYTVANLKG